LSLRCLSLLIFLLIEALESIIEQLQRQNAEQQELLRQLSEDWRNDCERHHKETLEAVKSTAQEQVPFNVQGVSLTAIIMLHNVPTWPLSILMNSARRWQLKYACF